jgi:hypothetical protein
MRKISILVIAIVIIILSIISTSSFAAYHHAGEADAPKFLTVYPDKAGTKLDNCALCHCGGSYTSGTKTTVMGSCQWCHYKYKYDKSGDITATLNAYGQDYFSHGRNEAALTAIGLLDSDGDGFSNISEINAIRYPGDSTDDPTKVIAPFRIFSKAQLQAMPQHTQFLLMNTTKSGDYYAEYSGVIMENLLTRAGITNNANKITVYAPDGFSQGHPLQDSVSNTGSSYAPFVNGTYPAAPYFYDVTANKANGGWCDYSSPGNAGRTHGDPIIVQNGLRLILALRADGVDLVPGALDSSNKLASGTEGPFRVIAPQKIVGAPDQASTASNQNVLWPYNANADHNAGFCSKSATIIKVEPLPAGTTDINVLEAGWGYIDQGKIVIYGALEGPALISPAAGKVNVPRQGARLVWTRTSDTDPSAAVTYTIEISKDQVNWTTLTTQVSSLVNGGKIYYAGVNNFFAFSILVIIAFCLPRRLRKLLAISLLIVSTGVIISSCTGSSDRPSTESAIVTQTLDAGTTYYWRVTADGPNSHSVSAVSSFTTLP